MVGEFRDSEVIASNTNIENINQQNHITNPNSNEKSSKISRDELQEFLNTVMQGIKESAQQTVALEEQCKKQSATGQEECKKNCRSTGRILKAILQLYKRNIRNRQPF
jgi:hypothetical protein